MRLSPQEEYGLRCLLSVARLAPPEAEAPVSIERIADTEGLGYEHAAKMLRLLRRGDLVTSTRGVHGGYRLARAPGSISVWEALVACDPPLVTDDLCGAFKGRLDACTHAGTGCNLKALWAHVGDVLEGGLRQFTLEDLMAGRVPAAPLRAMEAR
jgi:Rrf2 family protein